MNSLFVHNQTESAPLAEKMRPKTLNEVVGQDHLVEPLSKLLQSKEMISFVLWGPPGTGKTTIAQIFAEGKDAHFEPFSAVSEGVKRIREISEQAKHRLEIQGQKTILFIDEIHALKKTQQDVLLPLLEKGTVYLIGATTENPGFSLNAALLSRARVFLLKQLGEDDLKKILKTALDYMNTKIDQKAESFVLNFANGDARSLLSLIEAAIIQGELTADNLLKIASEKKIRYDQKGDEHYSCISAFIKSMRASDQNATLYYLARMLEGGEDPRFIARRMVIFASEDIGLADAQALPLATSAYAAAEKIGMPEIRINLGHVATYLALAPKNNSTYLATDAAIAEVKQSGNLPVPLHLRSPSTSFSKELGYGQGYQYPHSGPANEHHLPKDLENHNFFEN